MAGKIGQHTTFLRYGAAWKAEADPLAIELECIRNLGKWEFRGRMCGNGLPYHVKAAMRLLWPNDFWHRWCDLIVDSFLKEPGRTGCWGPSSTGKSWVFSKAALTMFYARPKGTTVLISSTTRDDLQRRIWGYVTEADKAAREIYPDLPGHFIESEMKLLADSKDTEGRSKRDGIMAVACKKDGKWDGLASYVGSKNSVMILVCDECFPAGTAVDTPQGRRAIEDIQIGDKVYNAQGVGTVEAVSVRVPTQLLAIHLENGQTIQVTPNHPFFTQKGWIKACDLNQSHYMLATHEAMRILQDYSYQGQKTFLRKLLFKEVVASPAGSSFQKETPEAKAHLRLLWDTASARNMAEVLQLELRDSMAVGSHEQGEGGDESNQAQQGTESGPQSQSEMGTQTSQDVCVKNHGAKNCVSPKNKRHSPRNGAQAEMAWWEWNWPNKGRISFVRELSRRDQQPLCQDISAQGEWVSDPLQAGCGNSASKTWDRMRRVKSLRSNSQNARREKDPLSDGTWVDHIEVLQPGDYRTQIEGGSPDLVYNLQVSGHPSYSVNGLLVHNCQFMPVGFLDALANLESNEPCYAALMGNLPDVENPLGWACEPKQGWEGLSDSEVSRVFETKWVRGRAIQLIGMDSPNLDFPEGQEPYKNLIGRRYIEQCRINYGSDSTKFHMFASGKVPQAGMHCTVFTKQECIKHEASASVLWNHEPKPVRGYGMDAAYSGLGGDRTVGFPFVFGKDTMGKWRFWLGPMHIYPGSRDPKVTHAEAIAVECKRQCEAAGIPAENVFFDGTGRSELTSAFARLWSAEVVPLEFGGPATTRPAFTGEMWRVNEKKEKVAGTTKTCAEVFDRFVTELWFAMKWCIVADQMRGMPQEAIDEGSLRKFEIIRGGRESVETKEEMKERGLRSCDIADAIVCAIEGARRLGFPLGKHTTPEKRNHGDRWYRALKEQERDRQVKGLLAA